MFLFTCQFVRDTILSTLSDEETRVQASNANRQTFWKANIPSTHIANRVCNKIKLRLHLI